MKSGTNENESLMEWRIETKQIMEDPTKGFNYHRDTTLIMGDDVL